MGIELKNCHMSEQGNISKAKLLNGLYRKRAILPNGVGINGIPD